MTFAVKVIGQATFQKVVKDRQKRISDRKKINTQAIALVDRWIQDNFKSEGGSVGGWEKLSPLTRPNEKNKKILQDTGALKGRWKSTATSRRAIIESAVPYGIKHDQGIGVPERRIKPTNDEMIPQLRKLYELFIRKSLRGF